MEKPYFFYVRNILSKALSMSDSKHRDLQSQKYVTINTPPSLIEALSEFKRCLALN